MILDYIFEKDLDHRIYDLCREKKSLFVVFFLFAEKLHAFAFFSLSLECEIFDSILKCKVYESFHFLQFFLLLFCWSLLNSLQHVVYMLLFRFLLLWCLFVFIFVHSWYSHTYYFVFLIQHLENCYNLIWKQNAKITFYTVELNILPQTAKRRAKERWKKWMIFFWKQMLFKNVNMLEILKYLQIGS